MKKFANFISILATISAITTVIAAVGLLGFGIYNLYESNESKEERTQVKRSLFYHNEIAPKIDSLIYANPQLAIKAIDKLIYEYPEIYFLEMQKGIAYYQIDSLNLAIKEFKISMNKSGYEFPTALGYIGKTLVKQKKFDEAIVEFKKAENQNSKYTLDIAETYELRGDVENAIKYYEKRINAIKSVEFYKEQVDLIRQRVEKLKEE
ncbi:hypothetical protein IU405_11215 [Polaribacter sp. BAL334]|uniref:tetratricopeptide repeat protein n=1 Tax=Polaribacter sp. BAL334 TaxID=1708178 RepID=UPI0018D264D9|nr:hypothetical protein [Polaribacter sp. BAL334]MBG7612815.1 hypothetical protein [Polaribacter sp. BAL334]